MNQLTYTPQETKFCTVILELHRVSTSVAPALDLVIMMLLLGAHYPRFAGALLESMMTNTSAANDFKEGLDLIMETILNDKE